MSSKAEKERQKQIQDKCQTLLTQMLRDEDNKYCVDCDAKGPRWASWNLGIFLCIRCAGIHRNLGVHISKVKSVNLDSWTPEQVVSLQQMGNSRARAVYEANLPDNFRRPQTDSALEAFIRAKYEAKKYIAREWVAPPPPKVNWDKELDEEAERAKKKKRESKISSIPIGSGSSRKALDAVVPQPLPKPSTSPKPLRSATSAAAPSTRPSADLLGLDTPVQDSVAAAPNSAAEDMFSSFVSASASAPAGGQTQAQAGQRSAEEDSFFNQPTSQPASSVKLTTDSIMALYSKGPPQGTGGMPLGGFQPLPFGVPAVNGMVPPAHMVPPNQMVPPPQMVPPNQMVPPSQMVPPNQMVPPLQIPIQGAMFSQIGAPLPVNINPASNPFYNMAASSAMPQQGAPVAFPAPNRLSQQMSGLSLGPPSGPYQQPAAPPPSLWQ